MADSALGDLQLSAQFLGNDFDNYQFDNEEDNSLAGYEPPQEEEDDADFGGDTTMRAQSPVYQQFPQYTLPTHHSDPPSSPMYPSSLVTGPTFGQTAPQRISQFSVAATAAARTAPPQISAEELSHRLTSPIHTVCIIVVIMRNRLIFILVGWASRRRSE